MECVIALRFNDFALVATDTRVGNIITNKVDENKMYKWSKHVIFGVVGESGDTWSFAEHIQQNIQLSEMQNGYEMSPKAAANYARLHLAEALRSRNPYQINGMIAGYDSKTGPVVYYLDYLAALVEVPFAIHGYGSYVSTTILDRQWRPDMTVDEAVKLVEACAKQIQKRLVINLPNFAVKIVTAEGIKDLPDISLSTAA